MVNQVVAHFCAFNYLMISVVKFNYCVVVKPRATLVMESETMTLELR